MASFSHEFLVDLFRTRGELAPALLRHARFAFDHDRVEHGSIDLSQVVSTEYRADCVVVLRDRTNAAVAGVIVEVQLRPDRDKERTWPVYVAVLHAKLDCPAVLLVLTPDPGVARWALGPFRTGHPGFSLEPVVLGFDDLPRITDPAQAASLPELAVLSALANPDLDVAEAAIAAISDLPEDQFRLYLDVILAALPPLLRAILETRMQGYVYQSDFARKYYSQGLEEGREKGLEEGRGVGLRRAVLALLRAKLDVVNAEDEAAVESVDDERRLTELIGVLGLATSTADVRAALAAFRAGA
jgi:hypothetical protein